MELNKIHNLNFLNNSLPNKCANLIIADPPYYEVKGEFDFIWANFDAYLADVEIWAKECKRLLADNGTLFWWGHAKKIAYSQTILDKYFNLENNLVWEKIECQNRRQEFEQARCFAPVTERVLMYSNEIEMTGLEVIKLDINNFATLRGYFESVHKFIGISKNDIISFIGQKADHSFRYNSTQWDLPTPQTYKELIDVFAIDKMHGFKPYEALRQEYEALRQEYEALRRPFQNTLKLTDVLRFSQEAHISKQYDHPTQKPEKLTSALIQCCSRENDLVLIPFAGSGVECAMSAKYKRQFIGFDIEQKYCAMANKRVANVLNSPQLF